MEIAATRILSVVLWYHFAFLSISVAMLGLAAPGVWFALRRPSEQALPAALVAAGLAVPGCIVAVFKLGRPLSEAGRLFPGLGVFANSGLLLLVVSFLIPMLCLGAAVCLLLLRAPGPKIGRLYAADLFGASAAAVAVVPLMHAVPTPLIVAGAGFLPLVAAWWCAPRWRLGVAVVMVALAALMVWQEPFRLHYSKEYTERGKVLYERWTPTARITVFPTPFFTADPRAAFGWGLGSRYVPRPIEQLWIEQDGSAGTPITKLSSPSAVDSLEHLFFDVTSVAHQLGPLARVCVIGAGGGRDILAALHAGAKDVDAVELNPHIVTALSGPFADFCGDVYHLPGVRPVVQEGRSFLTHSRGGYDLLQISLIDSWAATAAGAFALSENYLYTTEALRLYWNRLSPQGVVSISRYVVPESLRLTILAKRALELEGVAEPARHIAVARAGSVVTVLLMKQPFSEAWIRRFDAVCRERGFDRQWPGPANSDAATILRSTGFESKLPWLDLSASTDDRPFFFQAVPVFGSIVTKDVSRWTANENSVLVLRGLLVLMPILAAALLLTPFAFAGRFVRHPDFWRGSLYFAAIGMGFMVVEGAWIQRFILYLGHPSHSTTVVLATLLLAAGAGSFVASRQGLQRLQRFAPLLPVAIVALGLVLPPLLRGTIGAPFPVRIALSVALLAPAGWLMGFAFPGGMMRFGDGNKAWFWAMNGVAGVVAIVFALALAMSIGLSATGLVGAGAYVLAAALIQGRSTATEPTP